MLRLESGCYEASPVDFTRRRGIEAYGKTLTVFAHFDRIGKLDRRVLVLRLGLGRRLFGLPIARIATAAGITLHGVLATRNMKGRGAIGSSRLAG